MTKDLVLGLVATLSPDATLQRMAVAEIARTPRVVLGDLAASKLPFAIETEAYRDQALLEGLRAIPGVLGVDVAYAHFLEGGGDEHGAA